MIAHRQFVRNTLAELKIHLFSEFKRFFLVFAYRVDTAIGYISLSGLMPDFPPQGASYRTATLYSPAPLGGRMSKGQEGGVRTILSHRSGVFSISSFRYIEP